MVSLFCSRPVCDCRASENIRHAVCTVTRGRLSAEKWNKYSFDYWRMSWRARAFCLVRSACALPKVGRLPAAPATQTFEQPKTPSVWSKDFCLWKICIICCAEAGVSCKQEGSHKASSSIRHKALGRWYHEEGVRCGIAA